MFFLCLRYSLHHSWIFCESLQNKNIFCFTFSYPAVATSDLAIKNGFKAISLTILILYFITTAMFYLPGQNYPVQHED